MRIDLFRMERMQSQYWHRVRFDLSESGVLPPSLEELFALVGGREEVLATTLGYPLSEGSQELRERIAAWYPGARADNVTVVNGGSEANHLALWTLLDRGSRLAFMVPNYMQGCGLGRHYGEGSDFFRLELSGRRGSRRWSLDLDSLERAVTRRTRAIMVCNPNNPTGAVLDEEEMDAVVRAARRARAWIVADEVYRGAELSGDAATPSFWGRYDKVVVTSGLSKAFGLPGLRIGWLVAPRRLIAETWKRHDYTTLTPGMISDRLASLVMRPAVRERVLARTRGIVRRNFGPLAAWIAGHGELFDYAPPRAGAIVYARYRLPIGSVRLVDRIRERQSVLLVPGAMFGFGRGLRFGFGYDIEHTLAGLARVSREIESLGLSRGRGGRLRGTRAPSR
jgi:aspartate/methionine/tyrosine aminotransferase